MSVQPAGERIERTANELVRDGDCPIVDLAGRGPFVLLLSRKRDRLSEKAFGQLSRKGRYTEGDGNVGVLGELGGFEWTREVVGGPVYWKLYQTVAELVAINDAIDAGRPYEKSADVGRLVEVKAIREPYFRFMIVQCDGKFNADTPVDDFIYLAVGCWEYRNPEHRRVRILGWMWGHEVRRYPVLCSPKGGPERLGRWVPLCDLHSPSTLIPILQARLGNADASSAEAGGRQAG